MQSIVIIQVHCRELSYWVAWYEQYVDGRHPVDSIPTGVDDRIPVVE
jgi:hypothetical protein